MKKKYLNLIFILCLLAIASMQSKNAAAQIDLKHRLAGKILLQVESWGMSWYVNPFDYERYYLGSPRDAFALIKSLGTGIKNKDLEKIPIGIIEEYGVKDEDKDTLSDDIETAIGSDPKKSDTNNNGYNDRTEINNGYNPALSGKMPFDKNFINANLGKIFLQVESRGQAWYVNPNDKKRYFLNKPADAFSIMQKLSLGITNNDLATIPIGLAKNTIDTNANIAPLVSSSTIPTSSSNDEAFLTISKAATAIRDGKIEETVSFFIPSMEKTIRNVMRDTSSEQKYYIYNLLMGSKLTITKENQKIYTNTMNFYLSEEASKKTGMEISYKAKAKFIVSKQSDGKWLLENI